MCAQQNIHGIDVVAKRRLEELSEQLKPTGFEEAKLTAVTVGSVTFHTLVRPARREPPEDVCFVTPLSMVAYPRYTAHRQHFVLVPPENILPGRERSVILCRDVRDMLLWSVGMNAVTWTSSWKSGASYPFTQHMQSVPFVRRGGTRLTTLLDAPFTKKMTYGLIPHFEHLQISLLKNYPIRGLRIETNGADDGITQVARYVYMLAKCWDECKAFNVVVTPNGEASVPVAFFFPRRRTGRAVFGGERHQIAGIECSGLICARSQKEFDELDGGQIKRLFVATSLSPQEFDEFLELLEMF